MPRPCSGSHRTGFYEALSDLLPNLAGIEVCFGLLLHASLWQGEKLLAYTVAGAPAQAPLLLGQQASAVSYGRMK